ncbi:uncharacterized protein LOC131619928 [Vicia villosa]|uniref:uncharacterized protein LOC131619928 n=1 Tax=Vicia villosa TaxID=3911 RepID=UPI00273C05F1|nr:uncharacterized protein LOC131619928 [Vicia villosa]
MAPLRIHPPDRISDPSSSIFIHPNDSPNSVAVSPKLTGPNYHYWARSMKRALGGKLKLEFIDESLPPPIDAFDPLFRAWNRCNMLENVVDVWNDLKERFSQGDLIRISELQQEIFNLKQEVMHNARSNHKLLRIIRFFTSLNDNFSVVKSQILLMEPLPPLNKIFSMVIQHERQNSTQVSTNEAQTLINATDSKTFPSKHNFSKAGARVCTFCGKTNHTVENCFKKIGVPPHMQKQYSTSVNNAGSEGNQELTSNSLDMKSGSASSNQVATVNSSVGNVRNPSLRIVDSGANDHICGSMSWFQSYTAIPPINVRLPNGHSLLVKYSGTIALWNFGLGHLSQNRLSASHSLYPCIVLNNKDVCDICHYARQRKLPYNDSTSRALHPYDMIHFDIWGSLDIKSLHGHSYFLIAVDDCNRYIWITLMKTKSEARQHVINFVKLIEKQYAARVKTVKTDNGPEFNMLEFYATNGIVHQTSCVESSQQNGTVKRKRQHLLNVGIALLFSLNFLRNSGLMLFYMLHSS